MTSYVEVGHARQEIASGAARNLEVSHTAPAGVKGALFWHVNK